MSRAKFRTSEFAEALTRNVSGQVLQSNEHLLNDYKFGNDFCYPIVDWDRGPTYKLASGPFCPSNSSVHDSRAYLPDRHGMHVVRPIANVPDREYTRSKLFGHIAEDE